MRRAEMARRRKNLSEKRNEEEKVRTIQGSAKCSGVGVSVLKVDADMRITDGYHQQASTEAGTQAPRTYSSCRDSRSSFCGPGGRGTRETRSDNGEVGKWPRRQSGRRAGGMARYTCRTCIWWQWLGQARARGVTGMGRWAHLELGVCNRFLGRV